MSRKIRFSRVSTYRFDKNYLQECVLPACFKIKVNGFCCIEDTRPLMTKKQKDLFNNTVVKPIGSEEYLSFFANIKQRDN